MRAEPPPPRLTRQSRVKDMDVGLVMEEWAPTGAGVEVASRVTTTATTATKLVAVVAERIRVTPRRQGGWGQPRWENAMEAIRMACRR